MLEVLLRDQYQKSNQNSHILIPKVKPAESVQNERKTRLLVSSPCLQRTAYFGKVGILCRSYIFSGALEPLLHLPSDSSPGCSKQSSLLLSGQSSTSDNIVLPAHCSATKHKSNQYLRSHQQLDNPYNHERDFSFICHAIQCQKLNGVY